MSVHKEMMRIALQEARKAQAHGEVPVGAVIARDAQVIAMAHNRRETDGDPTAHAEMLVIREAASILGTRRLNDCTLYVTLEPCPMCAGALVMACVGKCYFGARDERQGCVESIYALSQDPAFYHRLPCVGGILAEECSELLLKFFQQRRTKDKGVCDCDH